MLHVSDLKIPALSALGALVLLGIISWRETLQQSPAVLIAIEHHQPLAVTLSISARGGIRLIDLSHDGTEHMFVSVPETWERSEVRGVPLSAVTSESPAMGFVRWTLPPKATVRFRARADFRKTTIHNPSKVPLTLRWTAVDLATNRAVHDVTLIKDAPATIP